MKPARFLSCFVFAAITAASPQAGATFPTLVLKPVSLKQIHSPTTITFAPDGSGRLFVCDEPGKIYIIQGGMVLPTPFLNIASPLNVLPADQGPGPVIKETTGYSERGLLGLAFHPGYANPASPGYRKFYLNYNKSYVAGVDPIPNTPGTPADCVSVIAEFQVSAGDPNVAVVSSERRLLLYTQPQSNHNGGQLEFGPEIGPGGERYLYIGVGDGGSQEDNNLGHTGGNNIAPRPTNGLGNAQDKTRLFGKILRIDPLGTNGPGGQYGIPINNPFVGVGGGVREEIYSFGMRNPWRFSFDKRPGGTNRLFCGDVGGGRTEEIDLIVSGGNYGWRYKEGAEFPLFSSGAVTPNIPMPDPLQGPYLGPIASYAHPGEIVGSPALPQLGLSVTGGFVYRGPAIPALQGKFVFGDYGSIGAVDGRLMGLEETAPLSGVFTLTQALPLTQANPLVGQRVLTLGEDESGEIYVGLKTNNGVLQLGTDGLPAGGIYKIVPLQNVTTSLSANKDNTIFSEDVDLARSYSDGLGYLYAGRTGSNFGPYNRRALIAFDIAGQVPAGASIQSVQVKLNLNKMGSAAGGTSLSLHRLTQTWGEGTSVNVTGGFGAPATTNDATWLRTFFNTTSWTTAGGTFIATASASRPAALGLVTWDSATQATLKTDVQGWLDTPANNAGWILRGDEFTDLSACRFDSKDAGATPPALALTYTVTPPPTHFESWLATYFPANYVGQYVDPAGDIDGDGVFNLIEYAYGFSPLAANPANSGLQVSSAAVGANTVVTIIFLRDSLATDLTYELQTSGDLGIWTTIVTSAGGAGAFGSGFVSESGFPISVVTAQETFPTPTKRFVRLRVSRAP